MTKNIMIMHKVFIVLALIIAFFAGASNQAKQEIIAMECANELTAMSFRELGNVRVDG